MSKLSEKVYSLLKELFPYNIIFKEYYIRYNGVKLFFDFYVKDLPILVECDGRQHSEFISHFHVDRDGFFASKKRDNLKIEYAEYNRIPLVIIKYDDKITRSTLLRKIIASQNEVLKYDRDNN